MFQIKFRLEQFITISLELFDRARERETDQLKSNTFVSAASHSIRSEPKTLVIRNNVNFVTDIYPDSSILVTGRNEITYSNSSASIVLEISETPFGIN